MSDEIRVEPYRPEHDEAWDALVADSRSGTLFHTRRFLHYHPDDRFEDASLVFIQGDRPVAVLPAAWRDDPERGRVLQSHPGASYGGPVFARTVRTAGIDAVVTAIREHARAAGADAIRMRLAPHVFHRPPLEELDFVLRFQGFRIFRSELSMALDLASAEHDEALLAGLGSSCRRAVRKALKSGLEHGESDDVDQYWEILADNLERRFGESPTHTAGELHRLRELCPGEVRLFVAREGDRILGGTLVMLCNPEAAHAFYLASREEDQDRRPLNLAVYSAMCWLRANGWKRYNLGVSTPHGESVNWGLLSFKESFNATGAVRDSYELVLRGPGAS